MTPDEHSVPLEHPDYRGTTGEPPEGRRATDPVHVLIAEKLADFEIAAKVAKNTAQGTRNIIVTIAVIVGAILSVTAWLGAKNLGPGARADAIEDKVDRNFAYALRNDSTKARRDSTQDATITRMLEGMNINAYQICMTQTHSDGPKCNRIMSHDYNP